MLRDVIVTSFSLNAWLRHPPTVRRFHVPFASSTASVCTEATAEPSTETRREQREG